MTHDCPDQCRGSDQNMDQDDFWHRPDHNGPTVGGSNGSKWHLSGLKARYPVQADQKPKSVPKIGSRQPWWSPVPSGGEKTENCVGLLTAEFIWLARSELFLLKLLKLVLFFDSIFFEKFFDFLSRIFWSENFWSKILEFFSRRFGPVFRVDFSWAVCEMHFFGAASESSCG